MNNITVERVLKAYESGVVYPGFEGWGNREKNCGCAITAVAIYEKNEKYKSVGDVLDDLDYSGSSAICEAVDITWAYMLGFTDAFDGLEFGACAQHDHPEIWGEQRQEEYQLGYEHGMKVRASVVEAYPELVQNESEQNRNQLIG